MDSAGLSRSFTTSVERRAIGVMTQVNGDYDGARLWLGLDLSASSDRGGEKLVKIQVRPVVPWDVWVSVAVVRRDEAEKILRSLPGDWWSSRRKLLTSELYTLRVRAEKVDDPLPPDAPIFVDSK